MAGQADLARYQRLADWMVLRGEPGQKFEKLVRLGWREPSYGQGDGLQPCPSECGVCHPVPTQRRKRR